MKRILNQRGSGLLSLLIALVIIGLIYYFATKSNQTTAGTPTKSFIRDAGVDTTSYKGTLDSTKKIIKDAEATRADVP